MSVRRRAGSARKMMAFSRIVACHTEDEYEKTFKKAGDDLVLVEFVAGWSTSSKSMQPYMNTLAKSPEYKRVHFVRVDMEALPAIASKCNVKALPTYQLYKNGEKLEEMSGAMPAKLVGMLKQHAVQEKKGGVPRIAVFFGVVLAGALGLLKLKAQIEEWEAAEEEREAIRVAEEEARKLAEESARQERLERARQIQEARRAAAAK